MEYSYNYLQVATNNTLRTDYILLLGALVQDIYLPTCTDSASKRYCWS